MLHFTPLHSTSHFISLNYAPLCSILFHYTLYTPLHSISLHFTPLHFITLHFILLHFTTLHFTSLHSTLYFISLHYAPFHSITFYFTPLHFIHSISLHYTILLCFISPLLCFIIFYYILICFI